LPAIAAVFYALSCAAIDKTKFHPSQQGSLMV
jgi:hypothetical protein